MFQMDMSDECSWFSLKVDITHQDRPMLFGPKLNSPFTTERYGESLNPGICTKGQRNDIWINNNY